MSGVSENSICSQRLHIVYTKSLSLALAVFLRSKFHIASIYIRLNQCFQVPMPFTFLVWPALCGRVLPNSIDFSAASLAFIPTLCHRTTSPSWKDIPPPPLINKGLQKLPEGTWDKEPSSYGKMFSDS